MWRSSALIAGLVLVLALPSWPRPAAEPVAETEGMVEEEPGASAERTAEEEPLLFGVVSFYYPRRMFLKYEPLVSYLSGCTGRRWELRLGATYDQTVSELCSGRLTAAYLGPLTYIRAHAACDTEPVARLNTGGRETYRSYILVRADSPIREITDLRGKRMAFGSALSTSSHLVPRAILVEAGMDLQKDVICSYLEHHEEAARAVVAGEVDACGVRDIVGDRFLTKGLRLLVQSDPIPNFPIAVAPGVGDDLRQTLTHVLVDLPREDPAKAAIMAGWDRELADGFAPATDAEYDRIRELATEVLGAGALALPEEALRCAGSRP
jgi:phosphonate transport system substrate-binding protein